MLPMHPLQVPQRDMRINLRRSNIRMSQQSLHTPQISPVLHHMRRATMPQHMRTHLRPCRSTNHLPNPLPSQRLPPHTQKQSPRHHPSCLHQLRPPHRQITLQRLHSRAPQRHNPLLIALSSHLRAPLVQMQILHPQRTNLPNPQPTRIQQLQNRMIPQRQPIRIRRSGSHARPFQHLANLAFRKRLRQHLPARWRLHVHRRIMINPLIHQQPAVKPTQTTQLPCNRPRLHRMPPQSFHKPTHIRLRRPHQQPIAPFHMLGKLLQIPPISLTTRRPQPLLYSQISHVLPNRPGISTDLARLMHRPRLSRPPTASASATRTMNQSGQHQARHLPTHNPPTHSLANPYLAPFR
jgi:hypothetical protein